MWSFWLHNTRTGDEITEVFPSDGNWARALNAKRSGQHTFQMGDQLDDDLDWDDLLTPWVNQLVVQRDDGAAFGIPPTVVYAGTLMRCTASFDDDTVVIDHEDIFCIWDRRYTFGTNGYSGNLRTDNDLPLNGLQYRSIISAVLASGLTGPGNYALPIVLPPAGLAGGQSRHYYDDKLTSITKALEELMKVGPDIDFMPRKVGKKLEWVVRVGDETSLALTGDVFDFYMMAENPGLTTVTRTRDGAAQTTSAYKVGEGSGRTMIVRWARRDSALPALDRVDVDSQIDKEEVAQSHADANLATNADPTVQWGASIMAGEYPGVGALKLGSILQLHIKGKRGFPDGIHVLRLIGLSGDMGEEITLAVQPFGGSY
jgi:hypothetical protein